MISRLLMVVTALTSLCACERILFSDHVGCDDCDPGVELEGSGGRLTNPSETYPWIRLINACMAEGQSRTTCIDSLPPEILTQLERWEAEDARIRRYATLMIRSLIRLPRQLHR
jgi:hypothetical protein